MKKSGVFLYLIILIAIFFEVWKIWDAPIEVWDESRRGINALSMMTTGEYFTYYFVDKPDLFNSKPPLTLWLIVISFKIFGITNFALRFHSILAISLFLVYITKIILLYRNQLFATLFIGILITVKGIIGFHVGRTGDTDSLLLLFLTASVYYFLKYMEFDQPWAVYLSSVFLGLAFYTKSIAAFIILPGIFVYMIIYDNKKILTKEILISGLILGLIVLSWVIPAMLNHPGDGNSVVGRMVKIDLVKRFTDQSFEGEYDPFYVFHVLDMSLNLWNYLLYVAGAVGAYRLFKMNKGRSLIDDKLILFSLLIVLNYIVILNISVNKHRWYLAPALPFFIILTVEFIYYLEKRYSRVFFIVFILIAGLSVKRFTEINNTETRVTEFFEKNSEAISSKNRLFIDERVEQNLVFECMKHNYRSASLTKGIPDVDADYIYFGPDKSDQANLLGEVSNYYLLLTIKEEK